MVDREEEDQEIIAVPRRNPRYDQIHTMDQVFPHVRRGRHASAFWTRGSDLRTRSAKRPRLLPNSVNTPDPGPIRTP